MENTKKCPYCGKEIKAVAKKCRYCGNWPDESVKQQTLHNESLPQRGKSIEKQNRPQFIIIGGCFVIAIVIAIVLIVLSKTHEDNVHECTEETNEVVEAAEKPYSIEQVIENIKEYDAQQTPEEKVQEPWRKHLNKLQGSYLIDRVSSAADLDMIHNYGKYVISGNTITKYEWNESSKSWRKDFSSEFQLFKFQEDGYMTGYNLLYIDQYGNECRMCSGDLNEDGVMDLWHSDSIFWTKQ